MSDGTIQQDRVAHPIKLMKVGASIPTMVAATGMHRVTASKWVKTLADHKLIRPCGFDKAKNSRPIKWKWV